MLDELPDDRPTQLAAAAGDYYSCHSWLLCSEPTLMKRFNGRVNAQGAGVGVVARGSVTIAADLLTKIRVILVSVMVNAIT